MVMRASATPQVQSGTMHAALTMDKCVMCSATSAGKHNPQL